MLEHVSKSKWPLFIKVPAWALAITALIFIAVMIGIFKVFFRVNHE